MLKLNTLYKIKRDSFNQGSYGERPLAIPVGGVLSMSHRQQKKVKLTDEESSQNSEPEAVSVSLNQSEDKPRTPFELSMDSRPADWRLREIIRNLNIAFSLLIVLMCLMVYISVIYLLHVWQINPLDPDAFRLWDIISLVSQLCLCCLFVYYYTKIKAFYSPASLAKEQQEPIQQEPEKAAP
jgi:hypothetical protein